MKIEVAFVVILCVCLSLIVSSCAIRDAVVDNKTDKQTARTIIDAVNEYRKDHSHFPKDIDLLVPEYLERLPKTARGGNFFYNTFHDSNRGDDYTLCFHDDSSHNTDYGCCYMYFFDNPPHYDGWDCTRGVE